MALIASAGIWKTEKTYLNFFLSFLALIVAIFLNFLLIPKYSIIGAAHSTAVTFIFWVTLSLAVSESLWRINYPLRVIMIQLSIAYIFTLWFTHNSSFPANYFVSIPLAIAVIVAEIILTFGLIPFARCIAIFKLRYFPRSFL